MYVNWNINILVQGTEVWESNEESEGGKSVLYIGGRDESNKAWLTKNERHGPQCPQWEESSASAYGRWHGSWKKHCS